MKRVNSGDELGKVLTDLGELAGAQFGLVLRRLTVLGFSSLVQYSAEDTGYLKSAWKVSLTNPPQNTLPHPGGDRFTPANFPGMKITVGDNIHMYNQTEYAEFLEVNTAGRRAQPTLLPTYYKLLNKAEALSRALSAKKYNV